MTFVIKDWTNTVCFHGKTFEDSEDAWGFIRETFDHLPEKEFDDEISEYFVVEE